jgi:carboxymethylenebutenolidase
MKKLLTIPLSPARVGISLLLNILLSFGALNAQMTCCQLASMEDYQLLGGASDFVRAHAEPLPFHFVSQEGGEMMTFQTPDSVAANAFLIKAKVKSKQWLFVYQEWWGLNDYIKKQAETFYTDLGGKVNVIAIDMYDGKVATTREDAGKYMGEAKKERLESIMRGAVNFVGKKAKIASVGWCFGGGLSLQSAMIEGKQAVGCIMYYGMPEKEVAKLKTLKTDVLGLFAGKEKWINKDVVMEFDKNMKSSRKKLTFKIFDSEHAFANPSNPNFDKEASVEAYNMAMTYLKNKFKI